MIHHGDCLEVLRTLPDNSVDAVVTDPPYGLSFMGNRWDYDVPSVEVWAECLRVLKPGGHLLAFAGTRTQHRMAVRIEDAGFEIRDMIAWVYGSGFPKSLDVSKAIDKAAGAEREVVDSYTRQGRSAGILGAAVEIQRNITAPATPEASQWQGWGTALKPALEPITVARKPLIGTVAENVLAHGTGALNVDGCRVGTETITAHGGGRNGEGRKYGDGKGIPAIAAGSNPHIGRWPANLIHDGSDEVTRLAGSAARFFYCAKASKADRDEGLDDIDSKIVGAKGNGLARKCATCGASVLDGCDCQDRTFENPKRKNHHPTVKPTDLMRYLCRLVTPPGGVVLDPFMGSGSTGKAARLEGANFIGIEREHDYLKIAHARIEAAELTLGLFK